MGTVGIIFTVFCFYFVHARVRIVERQEPLGIESCKIKCLRQSNCRSILYDTQHVECEIRFERRRPPGLLKTSIFILRDEIARPNKKLCYDSPCRRSSCITTRSSRQICSTRGCRQCQIPPYIENAEVSIVKSLYGGIAAYTCHPSFGYRSKKRTTLRCSRNCSWETTDFKCMKEPENKRSLPSPLRSGASVEVCGTIAKPKEFSIDFKKGQDKYLYLDCRFMIIHDRKIYVRVLLMYSFVSGIGSRPVEAKGDEFPFRWNSNFCLTVTRKRKSYNIQITRNDSTKSMFNIPAQHRGAADVVEARLITLTSVDMKTRLTDQRRFSR